MTRLFPDLPPYHDGHDPEAPGPNQDPPFPGSDEAVAVGCLCGLSGTNMITSPPSTQDQYIIRGDCPLHGVAEARRSVQMKIGGEG